MALLHFDEKIFLENDRVLLRPLVAEDYDLLLPFSLNEPDLWEFSLIPADGEINLKSYLDKAFKDRSMKTSYPFIVFDKMTQTYAGSTRFYDYQAAHNTIQLGYTWYGKDFQQTGLNRNCKLLLLTYAFDVLQLDRVEFRADASNERSITAMKKIGCIEEGVLRSNCASPTGRRDSIVLSILKDEWIQSVKSELTNMIRSKSKFP